MNKGAIQRFAIWARNELITQVSQRAYQYGIDKSGLGDASADTLNGRLLTAEEKSQRKELIGRIKEKGYKQVMEEVAYTWFNRFIALRYMEVNNYLPSHIRVFSDASGAFKPEILNDVLHLDLPGLDSGKVAEYIESNDTEALYRYLLLTQCNALNSALPVMFERMGGYTEMLLPNNILRQDSVLGHMVSDIPEEDWQDAVQIIGWLYQYYNTELKDDTFAQLKKNVKITKERIPAATQLFTPDWIVRYMVENSLGRLWLEGHPNAELLGGWKYYLDEAKQEPEVEAQLAKLREEYKTIKPEEIKVIDPCMGSGHILVYAFDVLMQIYTSAGWDQREAAQSILKNNLFGLDIDDRAAQLAYFAVMMKARQYDRRLLTRGIQPNIYSIRESNGIQAMTIEYFHKNDPKLKADIESIVTEMRDAKEYGSILNITPVDFAGLYARFDEIRNDINMMQMSALDELLPLVKCAELLAQKYDVVVTNPPYMGASNMNPKLNDFIKKNYADYKSDFFSAFVIHCSEMAKKSGYCGFFTPYVWMFIQSYEKMRNYLYTQATIETLIQFEYSAFEEATVPVCTFAFQNRHVQKKGCYLRLVDFRGGMEVQRQKTLEAIGNHNCGFYYEQTTNNFSKIPGSPVAYWLSDRTINIFSDAKSLAEVAKPRQGLATSDNDRFLRFWNEVSIGRIGFGVSNIEDNRKFSYRWFPCTKGGSFRRWYGNNDYVVNWENDGYEIKNYAAKLYKSYTRTIKNIPFYFKEGLSWSTISSGLFSLRYVPTGFIFETKGAMCYSSKENMLYILSLYNTKIMQFYLGVISPTLDYHEGQLGRTPVIIKKDVRVDNYAKDCISLSRTDWDSYETSWDFKRNPLV